MIDSKNKFKEVIGNPTRVLNYRFVNLKRISNNKMSFHIEF